MVVCVTNVQLNVCNMDMCHKNNEIVANDSQLHVSCIVTSCK